MKKFDLEKLKEIKKKLEDIDTFSLSCLKDTRKELESYSNPHKTRTKMKRRIWIGVCGLVVYAILFYVASTPIFPRIPLIAVIAIGTFFPISFSISLSTYHAITTLFRIKIFETHMTEEYKNLVHELEKRITAVESEIIDIFDAYLIRPKIGETNPGNIEATLIHMKTQI